ncbi:MAG: hypothetical protein PHR16_04605 [Methylovulum sp.]|nr:hypothetical protein [Methylovulum sp.]
MKQFRSLLPDDWTVILLADRDLYAKWLFEAIVQLKWHPFLRVNVQGSFRPKDCFHWQPFPAWCLPRAAVGRDGEPLLAARKGDCHCQLVVAIRRRRSESPVKLGRPEAWPRLPEINEATLAAYATVSGG